MVRDLNELIRERIGGGDPDASEFLAKHGRFFPGARTFDDIIDQLAQRMAAMQSLMRSMSPEQRAELALDDGRAAARRPAAGRPRPAGLEPRPAAARRARRPGPVRWRRAARARGRPGPDRPAPGDGPAGGRAVRRGIAGRPGRHRPRRGRATCSATTPLRELEALDDLARRLEEAGYLTRDGERLELTPRGSRRIGQKVLDDLFARLQRDAFGGHRIDRGGRGGERDETTKPYEFGDPFHLDLRGTLFNALGREENAPAARAATGDRRVRLAPTDFEVHRTEQLTQTSTVLLVDMSRSMLLRGCFLAAKKVAVALDTLIRTQYPRDHLAVIGFAYYAREIRPGALAELTWHGYEYGTNLQHGLLLARRILERTPAVNKEIVVITDGEPTAHFEDGQVEFNYPPTRRTIQETLREVQRCTKEGITINTFMLERSRALAEFVAHMTRLNRGRAFYATPEHLGEYVLVDFVSRRTKRVSLGPILRSVRGRCAVAAEVEQWISSSSAPFFLFLHVMGAILAFGPTFAYSIMGSMAGKEPQHANFSARQVEAIGNRLVYPLAIFQGITGVLLLIALQDRPADPAVAGRRHHPVPDRDHATRSPSSATPCIT